MGSRSLAGANLGEDKPGVRAFEPGFDVDCSFRCCSKGLPPVDCCLAAANFDEDKPGVRAFEAGFVVAWKFRFF